MKTVNIEVWKQTINNVWYSEIEIEVNPKIVNAIMCLLFNKVLAEVSYGVGDKIRLKYNGAENEIS